MKNHIRAMSLLGTVLVSACSVVGIRSGTEEPHYEVPGHVGPAELRTYAPRLAAETVVTGASGSARGEGFRRLAGYIFGGNAGGARIDMTAPVAQAPGDRIAMTVPVAQSPATGSPATGAPTTGSPATNPLATGSPAATSPAAQPPPVQTSPISDPGAAGWSIRFFLPAGLTEPPTPRDARVRIVTVPAETVAVLRFSGIATDTAVASQRERLLALLAPSGWAPSGPPVTWFYDPPWTLPPFRRNEVAVPVTQRVR